MHGRAPAPGAKIGILGLHYLYCVCNSLSVFFSPHQNLRRIINMSVKSSVQRKLSDVLASHPLVPGASLALIENNEVCGITAGQARVSTNESMTTEHFLQCASLSKTVAAAFAIEYFANRGVSMTESVNRLLQRANTEWRIVTKPGSSLPSSAADQVNLAMLVNHTALGMHYVFGIPIDTYIPTPKELLDGSQEEKHKYSFLYLERQPGQSFSYSGGGFVVLQYLIESIEQTSIDNVTRSFLDRVGLQDFTFSQLDGPLHAKYVTGHITREKEVSPALVFPPFAAGGLCTPVALATFLRNLGKAYHEPSGFGGIRHETARLMLGDETLLDLGALDFMGAKIGLGVFVARAGEHNRIMMHQAANDGFRGVYMLCYDGPDAGKGFVLLSNGDNPGVLFQCEMCRYLLGPQALNMQGIDFTKYKTGDLHFDMSSVKQESIVNKGLKNLVMDAFIPPRAWCPKCKL